MERACKNCRFCIYALSMRGKEEPYCERHSKWIGDTLLCSEWEMVSVPKPQTNYDRLVSKTPEEMAEFMSLQEYRKIVFDGWLPLCNHVMGAKICHKNGCKECWLDWLKSPAEEGE